MIFVNIDFFACVVSGRRLCRGLAESLGANYAPFFREGGNMQKKQVRWVASGAALVLLFAIGLRTGRQTKAAEGRENDKSAITAVLSAQQAAWNRGDVDAFLVGYWHSPELTFSGSNGVSRGWDGVMARYKKNYPDRAAMGQLDFSELEFRFLGPNAALVLGHWHLKRDKGDIGGVFSLVWQRFPDGWKIVHDHTSAVEK
jgi:ketosteroid isomerase-like protein